MRDFPFCLNLVEKSYANERIPLVMTSTRFSSIFVKELMEIFSFHLKKNEIFSKLFDSMRKNYMEFNLREAASLKKMSKLKEYMVIKLFVSI